MDLLKELQKGGVNISYLAREFGILPANFHWILKKKNKSSQEIKRLYKILGRMADRIRLLQSKLLDIECERD